MFEPVWKRLVEALHEQGFESRYLDRLMDRLSPAAVQIAAGSGFNALQREIVEEMASALCRAEDKVNLAMLQMELADAAVTDNRDAARVEELEDAYEARRKEALRARWEFMVHREAIGMIKHDVLDALFPIPRRRRRAAASAATAANAQ